MKALVGTFNQEKAPVIVKPMDRFTALQLSNVTRVIADNLKVNMWCSGVQPRAAGT